MNTRRAPALKYSAPAGRTPGPASALRVDSPPPRLSRWNARHGPPYPDQEPARGVSPLRTGRPQDPTTPLPHARPHVNFKLTPLHTKPRVPITPLMHALPTQTTGDQPLMLPPNTHHAGTERFFPTIPSYTQHPSQRPPTPAATDILHDLLLRPTTDWTLEDFNTPTESTGASVLLSLFVDFAHAKRPGGLTSTQCGLLADIAKVTHPARLLNFIQDETSAATFITAALSKSSRPPLQASLLRPADLPELVLNDGLRSRIHSAGLTRGDLLQILLPYFRFLYPMSTELGTLARKQTHLELMTLVYTNGSAHTLAQTRKGVFSPPTWYLLTHSEQPSTTPPPPTLGPMELRPIEHLGVLTHQFYALTPTQQKSMALSGLYSYLEHKLPPKMIIDALVRIGNAEPTDIVSLLQPMHFHTLVGLPPPRIPSLTLNRIKLILQHDGRGGSRTWQTSPGAVIQQWLMAVSPVLAHTTHHISLTLTPHGSPRQELAISRDTLPTTELLQPFAHRVRMSDGKFRRLELWLLTSCPELGMDLSHLTTDKQTLLDYTQQLSLANLWVQQAEKHLADSIPCVLLANSQPRDIDALIVGELQERLRAADFADVDIPFYVTWCSIATSTDSHSTLAKCVFTHPLVASAMTAVFLDLPTDDLDRFPVTGNYSMLPIPYPPTRQHDEFIRKAVDQQTTFTQSVTFTMLSGLPPTNWFTAPAQRPPSALQPPPSSLSPTWAQLFLHGSVATRPEPVDSPIIAMTTDHSCSRCYFTAYSDNAQLLLDYTRILHKLLTDWAGPAYTIKAEIREARAAARLLRPVAQPAPPPTTKGPDLQEQIDDLASLVRTLVTKLDEQSLRLAPPDAASITSTLSSASQSALSQCDTFLSTISSHFNSFLTDHSLQLASLYARSNSTDSRDQQLYNLVRSLAVESSTTGKRNDSFRSVVEQNTEQVAQLVAELSRLHPPAIPLPAPTDALDDLPGIPPSPSTQVPPGSDRADTPPPTSGCILTNTDIADGSPPLPDGTDNILTPPDLCAECASGGNDLCLCDGCSRHYHPACMTHNDTNNIMCRACLASIDSTESDTASADSIGSPDPSDAGTMMPPASDDDSTRSIPGASTRSPERKRLSPQGRARRQTTQRFTRSSIASQKQTPSYSQSTLSFVAKRTATLPDKSGLPDSDTH